MNQKIKILYVIAIICFAIMMPTIKVLADNELLITFQIDTGEESFPMEISMEFQNETTGESVLVECSYDSDYQWVMALEEGEYTLSSYKVTSSESEGGVPQELDYIVQFDDFDVSLNEGDKTVTGIVMDRSTYEAIYGTQEEPEEEEEETPLDFSWLRDGTTDYNVENPQEATNEVDIAYYTIPQDNQYFPGWTVMEIQEWYKQQVRNYLDTDYARSYLQVHEYVYADEEEYEQWFYEKVSVFAAEDITYYPTEEYRAMGPGQSMRGLNGFTLEVYGSYSSLVNSFATKEECTEFYEANKKLLDFILEYYWETGIQLNFNIWDYNDLPEAVAFLVTPSPSSEDLEEEDAAPDIAVPESDEAVEALNVGEEAVQEEQESGKAGYILVGIICAVLACGVGAGIYFYRKKDQ